MTTEYILITDIGSTTTKAILIDKHQAKLIGIEHADTTVEEPKSDVSIGIYQATKALQGKHEIPLLTAEATPAKLSLSPNVAYHATSSAGGGLQILVIGLTLFDSASSAKRAAYGAGGVILDVFAIDDKRSALEQMLSMRNLRPDMILLSGGIDGGAIASVLRLAEILRIAKPLPKFSTETRIPTIYAGNQNAVEMIKRMISEDFDLHILPNLRPKLDAENLKPSQDKIQELFMENVMERAPGYHKLKKLVSSQIFPTPAGVLKSILSLGEKRGLDLIAFDVGGATTDVFTRIHGHYQRTVSGNLGMSYSALNIMKESRVQSLRALLPKQISEDEIRNYVGNKTLYPTMNPKTQVQYRIEHALAKAAIKLSFIQHQDMHYNTQKVGYLNAIKSSTKDKYEEKFEYIDNEQKHYFYPSDISLVIGAGGVFAHAQNTAQCIDTLIGGFQPSGITELAIDRHFISPHLGVLMETDQGLATQLLEEECLQSLALYIRPHFPQKPGIKVLEMSSSDGQKRMLITDEFILMSAQPQQEYIFKPAKKCLLQGSDQEQRVVTDLPVIIDTRLDRSIYDPKVEAVLQLYSDIPESVDSPHFGNDNRPESADYRREVELPYNGDILKAVGDQVSPDEIVAVNRYNPPRLYVINTCSAKQHASEEEIRANLTVQAGDRIDFEQILMHPLPGSRHNLPFRSPVRGMVEFIDYKTGLVVASEIQDYSPKPVTINLAHKMTMPARKVRWHLKKNVGDFVYQGDMLAQKLSTQKVAMAQAPTTGEIVSYDRKTAKMTIQYKAKPHNYYAHVPGKVTRVEEEKAIEISYRGERLEASIGWGGPSHGKLLWLEKPGRGSIPEGSVASLGYQPDLKEIKRLADAGAAGIVAASMPEHDLVEYLGFEQGVINTGFEAIPCTLILMQGFGDLPYSPVQRDFLQEQNGKDCLLEPHTRIRAGVLRASINVIHK